MSKASSVLTTLLAAPLLAAALVLGLPFPQATALERTCPAITPVQEATSMRIAFVEWRIKKGREEEVLEYWATRATVADGSALIGEFLTRVESRKQCPWIVWNLDERWTTYYNVGLWRQRTDFQEQIGRFIDPSRPPLPFEARRRRRVFLAPERWRLRCTGLPLSDPTGVR